MSHVVVLNLEIKNLAAVKRMCSNLGWTFLENKSTYTWYGRTAGSYSGTDGALNQGISENDLGKCTHAISLPDCKYQLGLLEDASGKYTLLWDWYEGTLQKAMGGKQGEKFMQEYGLAAVQVEADEQGYNYTTKKLENGSYEIEVETY